MRNWPYAYRASEKYLDAEVGVTLLPKDNDSTHSASTLGGWQLMVNAASSGKQRKAAMRFIRFMTRKDIQEWLAKENGKLPALVELYKDPGVLAMLPFVKDKSLKELFDGSKDSHILALRPSTPAGRLYPQVSAIYREEVSAILNGRKEARDGVRFLNNTLDEFLKSRNTNSTTQAKAIDKLAP